MLARPSGLSHRALARPLIADQNDINEFRRSVAPLLRHFGFGILPPEALDAGIERMRVDLGLTKDRADRFALWALLHTLGSAPDLDVAFDSEKDREAARNFMDLINRASDA